MNPFPNEREYEKYGDFYLSIQANSNVNCIPQMGDNTTPLGKFTHYEVSIHSDKEKYMIPSNMIKLFGNKIKYFDEYWKSDTTIHLEKNRALHVGLRVPKNVLNKIREILVDLVDDPDKISVPDDNRIDSFPIKIVAKFRIWKEIV